METINLEHLDSESLEFFYENLHEIFIMQKSPMNF